MVSVDADSYTVVQRLKHLESALRRANVDPVDDAHEVIARLVPKQNIETWILCENGTPVDELENYKDSRRDWTELIRKGVVTLFSWTRPNATIPPWCVNSLVAAIPQLQKLDNT